MSKFDNHKVIPRYSLIAVVMTLLGVAVIGKTIYIMSVKHDYWMEVSKKIESNDKHLYPERGNILSDNGELLASSLPEYKLIIDFKVGGENREKLWKENIDSICNGLHEIFPEKSAKYFKDHLEKGFKEQKQYYLIWPNRVDYETYKKVEMLPIFNLKRYVGGFRPEKNNARKKPFGSLAARTIGDVDHEKDSARYGLEKTFDEVLRGQQGKYHRRKVMNRYLSFTDKPATNGDDIQTTINVQMQDIAEKAVLEKLQEVGGEIGVAILMEVETGDVKAIVNLERSPEDGVYRERVNHAVSDMLEPGSVFKTASVMVALDDGVADTSTVINTGNGQMKMYDRYMNDHNRGTGFGTISLGRALQVSSNIGVSYIIKNHYEQIPEKFVDGLYRVGMGENLQIPLDEYIPPRISRPKYNSKGKRTNWDYPRLPWMSIGYATQISPINTLAFYNAIANNGKMVRPRFVKRRLRGGEVVEEYPVVVLREQICKPQTLSKIKILLEQVVTQGTGRKHAECESFKVAGKTGTAQISQGKSGYKPGTGRYLASFAGYFPADQPRYSCIVCVQKTALPCSGGKIGGAVFKKIAEGVMARNLNVESSYAVDNTVQLNPFQISGNLNATAKVLSHLGYNTAYNNNGRTAWGNVNYSNGQYVYKPAEPSGNSMPDVKGLGARDAVFILERMGLRVKLYGRGKVNRQSIAVGTNVSRGDICELHLI